MQSTSIVETKSFAEILEEEWVELSEELEEKHFDAAFEAKVAEIEIDSTTTTTTIDNHSNHSVVQVQIHPKKSSCYSPYVPSNALRIQGMIDFIKFHPSDVFCDMGCGDGRVCFVVAAVQHIQQRKQQQNTGSNDKDVATNLFRAVGIDVSKDCIDMAQKHLITNQHLSQEVKNCIQFHQADLTVNPNELLNGTLHFKFPYIRSSLLCTS
jgi:SAM-dependent methyltransferase